MTHHIATHATHSASSVTEHHTPAPHGHGSSTRSFTVSDGGSVRTRLTHCSTALLDSSP